MEAHVYKHLLSLYEAPFHFTLCEYVFGKESDLIIHKKEMLAA